VIGGSLPDTASEVEIERATAGILEDDGYFQICNECGGRSTALEIIDFPKKTSAERAPIR
jgi:hypothetical protein